MPYTQPNIPNTQVSPLTQATPEAACNYTDIPKSTPQELSVYAVNNVELGKAVPFAFIEKQILQLDDYQLAMNRLMVLNDMFYEFPDWSSFSSQLRSKIRTNIPHNGNISIYQGNAVHYDNSTNIAGINNL